MQAIQRSRFQMIAACAILGAFPALIHPQQQAAPAATPAAGQVAATASSSASSAGAVTVPAPKVPIVQAPPPTPEQLGDSLMAQKRYQAAIEAYKQAPSSAIVWNKLGIAYQMMFNLDDAEKSYRESLKLNPKSVTVLNNLGTVYDSQKKYKKAEKLYRKALKIDPHSALVLKNLGTQLLARHKYKKGWEAYKAALTADPNIFTSTGRPKVENPATAKDRGAMNYYMAKGCVRAGFNERAIEYLRRALNEGFANPGMIRADHEFAALHGDPAFEQLLSEQKSP